MCIFIFVSLKFMRFPIFQCSSVQFQCSITKWFKIFIYPTFFVYFIFRSLKILSIEWISVISSTKTPFLHEIRKKKYARQGHLHRSLVMSVQLLCISTSLLLRFLLLFGSMNRYYYSTYAFFVAFSCQNATMQNM